MKLALLGALVIGSVAFAADKVNKASTEVDKSKNILTGTEKTVETTEKEMKDGHGNKAKAEVKKTTKVKKDGTVTQEVEVEADTTKKK